MIWKIHSLTTTSNAKGMVINYSLNFIHMSSTIFEVEEITAELTTITEKYNNLENALTNNNKQCKKDGNKLFFKFYTHVINYI